MEGGTELVIFLADCSELVGDGVVVGGDGHYAGNGDTEDCEDGAISSCDSLMDVRGEVLDYIVVELEATLRLQEKLCVESERGGRAA